MNENGIKLSNVMGLILLKFFRGLLHKIAQIAISSSWSLEMVDVEPLVEEEDRESLRKYLDKGAIYQQEYQIRFSQSEPY